MESPFEVLRIEPDADEAEIERAYRRRVKEAHPDHGGSAREFQRVTRAYDELTDGDRPASPRMPTAADDGGAGADADPGGAPDATTDDEDEDRRVEYLNYEVLDDYGWSLDDDDLFEKAAAADLDTADWGKFLVEADESLLEAAENRGFAWPFACRGGACANCAVAVTEGDLSMPVNHVLPPEMTDCGLRLSCVGTPTADGTKVVFNAKHIPDLDDLRLPPRPFKQAHASD